MSVIRADKTLETEVVNGKEKIKCFENHVSG